MTEAKRIRLNSIYSFLSISSRLIANVIVFWIIARYYGPKLFGQFTFAQTLATMFILFADFGFDVLLTNEIARDRARAVQLFQQFFSLKVLFTLVSLLGMWAFALINNVSIESKIMILIFSFYMVFTTLTNFLFALYKGFEKLEYETRVSLIVNVGLLIATLILIIIKANLYLIAAAFVITRLLGFIVGIKYSYTVLSSISYKFFFHGISEIRSKVLVYGIHFVLSYLFFQLDTILLALWKSDYEVGIYQAVFKIILIPLVIPDILVNTLTPALARLNVEDKNKWEKLGRLMNKILLMISLPICAILFVYSEQIISLIYGLHKYSGAVPLLKIFAITLFVRFNLETFALMLTTSNKQIIRMYVVIVATILNFSLNFIMIPKYGTYGAAIVSLITNAFVCCAFTLATLSLSYKWLINIKFISTLLISVSFTYLFIKINCSSIFICVPIIIAFFFLLAMLFFFSKDEKRLILTEKVGALSFKNRGSKN